jgi:signal transduction histidine kinase
VRYRRVGLIAAGVVLALLAYRVQVDNLAEPELTTNAKALAIAVVGLAFVIAGALTFSPRYSNRFALLMVAAGFLMLARQFRYSHNALLFTVFFALGDLGYVVVGHIALAYPTGQLRDRTERWAVRAGYATVLIFPLLILLVYPGAGGLHRLDPTDRRNLLLISAHHQLALGLENAFVIVFDVVLAALFVGLIVRRLLAATPRGRQILAPLYLAAVALALRAISESAYQFGRSLPEKTLFWWEVFAFIALPIALVDGVVRARLAHANVGDMMVELGGGAPDRLGDALARALRDRTLEIAFWLPDRHEYVDASGTVVTLPTSGDRAVTAVENDGEPVAALIHDPSLLDDPRLMRSAAAVARMSLENARLHAETRARLAQVQESRTRIVTAADEERRRIERDIHDGAQQRLVALGLRLRSAERSFGSAAVPEVRRLIDATVDELQVAVNELRELARGVHPAILTEDGLGAALESLGSRTPFPVKLETFDERLSPQVEAAAYFVASEALANVVKHSHASSASVTAKRRDGVVELRVEDDGVGGARAQSGSGLRGLEDRVEALGGHLTIESPRGGGTCVAAEIPCA